MDIFNLFMILILVALTAFFVAAEFAYIRIRPTRVDQLIEEGNKKAIKVKYIITHIEQYLSTAQLGITMSALAMGWIGESAFEGAIGSFLSIFSLPPSFEKTVSFALSFLIVTLFTVVVGELAPKNLAIQKAEAIVFFCSTPLIITHKILYPFTWILNTSATLIMKPLGLKSASEVDEAHSEEELRMIVNESYMSGEINQSEYKYVNNIFEFDNRIAKEIMVPRTEIVALDKDDNLEESIAIFKEQNFTRYPIIDGDKDHIIGMINAKEVLTALATNKKFKDIQHFIRPIIRVIDSIPIQNLLVKMQKERIHLAVLMDEYGGTSGLVTVEDILEEIVGEIRDEFDADEVNDIRTFDEKTTIVDAKVLVTEINDLLGTEIDDEDVDTIGGWFLTENYDAKTGDIVEFENYQFKIIEMDEHQVRFIEITKMEQNSEETSRALT